MTTEKRGRHYGTSGPQLFTLASLNTSTRLGLETTASKGSWRWSISYDSLSIFASCTSLAEPQQPDFVHRRSFFGVSLNPSLAGLRSSLYVTSTIILVTYYSPTPFTSKTSIWREIRCTPLLPKFQASVPSLSTTEIVSRRTIVKEADRETSPTLNLFTSN